ncbi:hypothetical protein OESDEN_02282 [Oesophagostomum dentatum]|uniref:Leucine Rich repeat-containing domain protein n=1 Tax=Oesophagostomum dentatum TaxID=61180 RepID=A0A0B1TPI9_OESDE|nr:hypothetical protein OESDEN_02282 [Oesophagostomum dentatum]
MIRVASVLILPHVVIRSRSTLMHLIADGNNLNENAFNMPVFPHLKTLSIDVNRVKDVSALLTNLRRSCPQLCSLSLIGNPGWCPSICRKSQQLYKEYRILPHVVIRSRSTLMHLIADGNNLNENAFNMPVFPRLKTLSIDVNRVKDVSALLTNLRRSCPQLCSLSLIGNPGWCPSICRKSQQLYKEYR